jgi:hypothetical protein
MANRRKTILRWLAAAAAFSFVLVAPAQCGPVRTGNCPKGYHVDFKGATSFKCVRNSAVS